MHKDYLKAGSRIFLFPAQTRDWAGGNIHPHKVSTPLRYFGLKPRTVVSNSSSTRDGDDVEITCTVHASPPAEVNEQFEENQDFLWLAHQRIQVFKLMLIGWNKKNYKKKFSKYFVQVSWYRNGGLLPADKTVVQTRGNRHSLLLQQVVTNWKKGITEYHET